MLSVQNALKNIDQGKSSNHVKFNEDSESEDEKIREVETNDEDHLDPEEKMAKKALKSEIEHEKKTALKVLASLFPSGGSEITKKKPEREPETWKDSDAEEESTEEKSEGEGEELGKETNESSENKPINLEDRFYKVTSTYHELFASPSAAKFSILGEKVEPAPLFSLLTADQEKEESQQKDNKRSERPVVEKEKKKLKLEKETNPEESRKLLQTRPLFFFHLNHPDLRGCAHLISDVEPFQRKLTMDEITKKWESTRESLTDEYKRKHKSTLKKKAKLVNSRKFK